MTALLTRLRIAGFKSFAEPASLDILPGLTGIVGPNGCGKSNVVEALRWAMGESSARSLRGGEMDDVIFAGTAARASRNLAEVTITLARGAGALPDPFGAEEELQVTRRIERGAGSAYRANGRELRARDVQTLFADMASGAKSSAMVSQGRVSALVNARPEDRRMVLEEAAGITGLHARRHEAELKLRAAETNLGRAEELRTQLESGRDGLRRQARQAARYRNISGLVRAAEADFIGLLYASAALAARQADAAQAEAHRDAEAAEQASHDAAAALEAAEAGLPGPRAAEAEARGRLERRRLDCKSLAADAERAERALAAAQSQCAVIEADLTHARTVEADADAQLARLRDEADASADLLAALPARIASAKSAAASAAEATRAAESASDSASSRAADAASAARQAEAAVAQAAGRLSAAEAQRDQAARSREAARDALIDPASLAASAIAVSEAEGALLAARRDNAACAQAREAQTTASHAARAELAEASAHAARISAGAKEAATRLTRLDLALTDVTRDLTAANAARIAAPALDSARLMAAQAETAASTAESDCVSAEIAHTQAGAARLAALAARDQASARRARLEASRADEAARIHRLAADCEALNSALEDLRQTPPQTSALTAAAASVGTAEATLEDSGRRSEQANAACLRAGQDLASARDAVSACAADLARLTAERDGVSQALGDDGPDQAPVLDALDVPAGLEAAIGALFADAPSALEHATPGASRFWRDLPPLPDAGAPAGCTRLDTLVQAPAALRRALAHAALLPQGADGDAQITALGPGWVLVSAQGDAWRWDGQVARAGAPNAAAARLRLRGRLRDLSPALIAAREACAEARQALAGAEAADAAARADDAASRKSLQDAASALAEARSGHAALQSQAEGMSTRLAALLPAQARAEADLRMAEAALADTEASLTGLPPLALAEAAWREASGTEDAALAQLTQARSARTAARQELGAAQRRLQSLEAQEAAASSQIAAWQPQHDRLAADRDEAAHAHDEAAAALAALPDLAAIAERATQADAARRQAEAALNAALDHADSAERARQAAQAEATRLERRQGEATVALEAAETMLRSADAAHASEAAALAAALAWQAGLPDAALLADEAATLRLAVSDARARWSAASGARTAGEAALADTRTRLAACLAETASWAARQQEAARRCAALADRADAARAECAALAEAPATLSARAAAQDAALAEAEAAHDAASQAWRAAEDRLRDAARAQRDMDAAQSACREVLARGEGNAQAAQAALRAVLERAADRLGPDAVLAEPGQDDAAPTETGADLSDSGAAREERARRKLDRLQRERDEMGPVNLCADQELDEIDARIAAIEADRDELTTAIAKLRGGIGHLNREGRERLTAVFAQVDAHFRTLFTRMMGGGRAHLALTGSDDPLEAGLEIYAEPPGKKLSALTLLSGGEQALTALSLIFAVFRCTPAPVAVLDEVDAPLDDVNVERFCGLLEDVVRDTGTRFLVVTHHQLTMSRMDRLFGVTMQERGVSRLLSVDLRRAAEMVEPVMQAAE